MKQTLKIHWMQPLRYALIGCCLLPMTCACSDDEPAPIDDTPSVTMDRVPNGSFENGIESWSLSGDNTAVQVTENGCEGTYALTLQSATDYGVTLSQTVDGLEDGLYDLEFYYQNGGGQPSCYVSAGTDGQEKMTSLHVSAGTWSRSYVRGIRVENGTCPIRIHTEADAGQWSRIDHLSLVKTDRDFTLLKGGDISELTYVEQNGGKYYLDGQEMDCIDILKQGGFNIARLRLYNDPGNPGYNPSNRLPAGIQDEEDILSLARRAKEAGMQIELTFHYSDYWTNGEDQNKPHEWEGLEFPELKQALYDFTRDFMQRMADQGTTPEYVSIGNEVQAGMLYPTGDAVEQPAQLAELFNAGYEAVKAVSPESKVIIHSNAAGNRDQYEWFFGLLRDRGVQYDIIGASYYPYSEFTNLSAKDIRLWADDIAASFDKDIILMEVGYAWNPTLPDGSGGQLGDNGPYTDMTPSGQKNFILDLIHEIKLTENCRILGFLYWDPIFIEVPGLGWELGGDNVVSNTTLFGFDGEALEVFDAFKYNN